MNTNTQALLVLPEQVLNIEVAAKKKWYIELIEQQWRNEITKAIWRPSGLGHGAPRRPTQTSYRKLFPFGSACGPKSLSRGLLKGPPL